MVGRCELTAAQCGRMCDLLPGKPGDRGRCARITVCLSALSCGCCAPARTGTHWHDLPERYGRWKTVHKRFTRWAKAGVWERVLEHLIDDPDNDDILLDSSLVRAPQQAATGKGGGQKGDQAPGCSRGGLTTKIHMAVEGLGRALKLILTAGQRGDAPLASALLDSLSPKRMLADKAYDSNALRALIESGGAEVVIPCNPIRKQSIPYGFKTCKVRNTVERSSTDSNISAASQHASTDVQPTF